MESRSPPLLRHLSPLLPSRGIQLTLQMFESQGQDKCRTPTMKTAFILHPSFVGWSVRVHVCVHVLPLPTTTAILPPPASPDIEGANLPGAVLPRDSFTWSPIALEASTPEVKGWGPPLRGCLLSRVPLLLGERLL